MRLGPIPMLNTHRHHRPRLKKNGREGATGQKAQVSSPCEDMKTPCNILHFMSICPMR